eukprot:scaffold42877_cov16-Tisochrysis_lutea.AAC.1
MGTRRVTGSTPCLILVMRVETRTLALCAGRLEAEAMAMELSQNLPTFHPCRQCVWHQWNMLYKCSD